MDEVPEERAVCLATKDLVEFKLVRYSAEPTEVLIADGRVPRHKADIESMSLIADVRVVVFDCCTRVFRRSNGCSNTEEVKPEMNPAARCDFVDFCLVHWIIGCLVVESRVPFICLRLDALEVNPGSMTDETSEEDIGGKKDL